MNQEHRKIVKQVTNILVKTKELVDLQGCALNDVSICEIENESGYVFLNASISYIGTSIELMELAIENLKSIE